MTTLTCDVCGKQDVAGLDSTKRKEVSTTTLSVNERCSVGKYTSCKWKKDLCSGCLAMIVKQLEALCTERQAD